MVVERISGMQNQRTPVIAAIRGEASRSAKLVIEKLLLNGGRNDVMEYPRKGRRVVRLG